MRSASGLYRHCQYPNVLSRTVKRAPRQQAALDLGTAFHKAVETWVKTGDLWKAVQDCSFEEVRGWLELLSVSWKPPALAMLEYPLGLSPDGSYEAVVEDPVDSHQYASVSGRPLLTAGRADVVWCEWDNGSPIAVTRDWKTGRYRVDSPPHNLQLAALGLAAASMFGANVVQMEVYYVRDGVLDAYAMSLDSEEAADAWSAVEKAATMDETPRPGEHCSTCWESRLSRCSKAQKAA